MAVHKIDDHVAGQARRFLLGRLPPSEAEQFAVRLVADDEVFDTVEAVEDELLDELVRNKLSPEDRRTLTARFELDPGRLRFAKALEHRTKRRLLPQQSMAWTLTAAASIVVLIGAGLFWRTSIARPPAPIPATASSGPKASPSGVARHGESIVALTIVLGTTRDEIQSPRLEIARGVTAVALTIRLHSADRYPSYDVALSRADGAPVWSGRAAAPLANDIKIAIPASLLTPGEYGISVAGLDGHGNREELGEQTLIVVAPHSKSQ